MSKMGLHPKFCCFIFLLSVSLFTLCLYICVFIKPMILKVEEDMKYNLLKCNLMI